MLSIATDWAKAEAFSSAFFILFGVLFVLASIGFWQLGKTDMAKAFVIPALVAGLLLMTIGLGLYFTNKARVNEFAVAYEQDAPTFYESEMERVDKSLAEYSLIVFKVIPAIVAVFALLIIFVDSPTWRAICITTIAMMVVILVIDSNANRRLEEYKVEVTQTR